MKTNADELHFAPQIDLAHEPDFEIGVLHVSPSIREISTSRDRISIEPRVMQTLVRLVRAEGAVVSREELIQSCWAGRVVGDDAINRCIAKVRQIAEGEQMSHFLVETIPRVGYRLIGTAHPVEEQSQATARTEKPSICVLPFANMSDDPQQEYFSDGITEDIITDLSKVSSLFVTARNTAFTFKNKSVDVADVARQLGVDYILEGSVRKADGRVRIAAQLIDGATGGHLWAERYDHDLKDIFALQDKISETIVNALEVKILPDERKAIQRRGTNSVEAYDLCLRAQALVRHRNAASIQRGIALYREAVGLDPQFAMAWIGLGCACIHASIYSPETADASRAACNDAFERAQACAPDAWMVHDARGTQLHIVYRDWLGAEAAFKKARALAPPAALAECTDVYFLAHVGRLEEAIAGYKAIVRSDPLTTAEIVQFTLDCACRYDEAEAEYRRVVSLSVDPAVAEAFRVLRLMARGNDAEIKGQLRRYLALGDNFMPIWTDVLTKFENRQALRGILHDAFRNPRFHDAARLSGLAYLAAYFGNTALALECLRVAFVELRGTQIVTIWHPLFADLRKTQGFKDLVRDLGLAEYWRRSGNWGDFVRPKGDEDFEIVR